MLIINREESTYLLFLSKLSLNMLLFFTKGVHNMLTLYDIHQGDLVLIYRKTIPQKSG